MTYYDTFGKKVCEFEDAKNAGVYSTSNEWGYAYIVNVNENCLYMVNIVKGELGLKNKIKAVNGNYYYDEYEGDYYYADFANKQGRNCHEILYELNQTITPYVPYSSEGIWSTDIYLCTGRGTWDSFFSHRANQDTNKYWVDMTYILLADQVPIDLTQIPNFNAGKIKYVGCWEYNGELYFPIQIKNRDGVMFSTIINKSGQIIMDPTCEIQLGFQEEYLENYIWYTDYKTYSTDSKVCMSNAGLFIARDRETELFGFIDITGNWVIEPQYHSVTDFYGTDGCFVSVVDNNTVIDSNGNVVFTIKPDAES